MNDDARLMFYPENKEFTKDEDRNYARERLVFNVTEDILLAMESLEISKVDLAKELKKSKSYITQLLSGERNMTLGTLSDICFALKLEPAIKFMLNDAILDFSNPELSDDEVVSEGSEVEVISSCESSIKNTFLHSVSVVSVSDFNHAESHKYLIPCNSEVKALTAKWEQKMTDVASTSKQWQSFSCEPQYARAS